MTKAGAAGIGAVTGVLLGYPLSYFFQPGVLRAKFSIGQYVGHAGDILSSRDFAPTAVGVWIGAVVAFAVIGLIIHAMTASRRVVEP